MSKSRFHFATGNLVKLLSIPAYAFGWLFSWFVPRKHDRWVFGSGIGVGEGALEVARALKLRDPHAEIFWSIASGDRAETETALAAAEGFIPLQRDSWQGFWTTLRARHLIVTHGLGDVNRYAPFRALVVQLWHGAPLKRIHLDSPVTMTFSGPAPLRAVLRRMYLRGTQQVSLFVAGSVESAQRMRSAFRVQPGKVQVLGDARDDQLARQAADPARATDAKRAVCALLGGAVTGSDTIIMYAPTWRDGETDAAIPTATEAADLIAQLERSDSHLVIRSHPLGEGEYAHLIGDRVHLLSSEHARDITPLLSAFDLLITDYSSIAVDFSLLHRPIVWFAPDLAHYEATRGLYEPLHVTTSGRIDTTWAEVQARLGRLLESGSREHWEAIRQAKALADRFHEFPAGGSAHRVLDAIAQLDTPAAELVPANSVFFESFYGRQVSCNPLAIDREIVDRLPTVPRYWSVTSEDQAVPAGAVPVLVGGHEWHAARKRAAFLVVNDWLRFGFKRQRNQVVLQTWHGTMLKHLALGRPNVSLRTRIAIRRESARWSLMISQNPHSTEQFRKNYAFKGEMLETGYPRDDRLAQAVMVDRDGNAEINPIVRSAARKSLSLSDDARVLLYAPTWRERQVGPSDDLDVVKLAQELGDGWTVIARGHTRTHDLGGYATQGLGNVIDVSRHPDINDALLACDLLVTDYSSVMFDAAVSRTPMLFFAPDLAAYRDSERGFTFDFEREAPGPILDSRTSVVAHALELGAAGDSAAWRQEYAARAAAWRKKFAPFDDGRAAARVVDSLEVRGLRG
ncbi:CDP-glycerol glycerophosphotransferase family protein [Leucobacter sp. cx-328]|uniref:CDP-glycerol glycerophosphotransferase family protein n=1 Tax=unclassified Leucobacter TaxID=2621730 RepID=UPI00165D8E62|nr:MULTISPECIES: CDP-glycerol glycerophosphotransferase family protein [unclassified Leucobacter]MBC9944472.1 CDP-glycerol glycerophosphotransferase family protein [Leucobacter sp. cx-328]